jgi:hypothetical protein
MRLAKKISPPLARWAQSPPGGRRWEFDLNRFADDQNAEQPCKYADSALFVANTSFIGKLTTPAATRIIVCAPLSHAAHP